VEGQARQLDDPVAGWIEPGGLDVDDQAEALQGGRVIVRIAGDHRNAAQNAVVAALLQADGQLFEIGGIGHLNLQCRWAQRSALIDDLRSAIELGWLVNLFGLTRFAVDCVSDDLFGDIREVLGQRFVDLDELRPKDLIQKTLGCSEHDRRAPLPAISVRPQAVAPGQSDE
jgi:hypothetical protein